MTTPIDQRKSKFWTESKSNLKLLSKIWPSYFILKNGKSKHLNKLVQNLETDECCFNLMTLNHWSKVYPLKSTFHTRPISRGLITVRLTGTLFIGVSSSVALVRRTHCKIMYAKTIKASHNYFKYSHGYWA